MRRFYLDVCCLNRPFDDQTQTRIRLESEAVIAILEGVEEAEEWEWVSSEVVEAEIARIPEPDRRLRLRLLASHCQVFVVLEEAHVSRALELERAGFKAFDAMHLACAESAEAELFVTTDDRLIKVASGRSAELRIKVVNPLDWMMEKTT